MLTSLFISALVSPPTAAAIPELVFESRPIQAAIGQAYSHALDNVLRINVLKCRPEQLRAGLPADPPGTFLRAGGDYQDPWTRDASVNSWNAVSLLDPSLAKNTLWAVCERRPDGKIAVQNDNQWWDKIIWVVATWNHYAVTGDRPFLAQAYQTATTLADELVASRYDSEFGLFQGPSHIQDGIAGYPEPFDDPPGSSSFVLDHPGSDNLMTLSVNCLYVEAFRCLAKMAGALNENPNVAKSWTARADRLRAAINSRLWMPGKGSYAYFLFGANGLRGKQARYQEASGISFSILFGIADSRRAKQVVQNARTTAHGIALIEPEFARYAADGPGRHSRIVWPLAQGYWADAVAKAGDVEAFRREVVALVESAQSTDWNFYEIYNPTTGKPDGGMQCGHRWGSCTNQTWSATALIRMIHLGLFGMSFEPSGIGFTPTLPKGWGPVTLKGLRYRNAVLDIRLVGAGRRVAEFSLDGKARTKAFLPAGLAGPHQVEIRMR